MNLAKDALFRAAIKAHQSGHLLEAQGLYQAVLKAEPRHGDAGHNLAILESQLGNLVNALRLFRQILALDECNKQYCKSYIQLLLRLGLYADARSLLLNAKKFGFDAQELNATEEMISSHETQTKNIKKRAEPPSKQEIDEFLSSYTANKVVEARQFASLMARRYPDHPYGWKALGVLERQAGRLGDALAAMQKSVVLDPYDAEAFSNLGFCLKNLGWMEESAIFCRNAIKLNPCNPDAHNNLGNALHFLGHLADAKKSFAEAIRLNPQFAEAYNNYGNVLKDQGLISEAQSCYADALRCRPEFFEAYSNRLFSLNYAESLSIRDAVDEAKRYGVSASARAIPKFGSWNNCLEKGKLRVGFVSGDFKNHPVGFFLEGLVEYLDRNQFELLAFPTDPRSDALTVRLKTFFDKWEPIYGLDDQAAALRIHDLGVHILIDLSGHSADNRLSVFSYKPAPCQLSWLGYFATTGLPEMDYFLGDPLMSPIAEKNHFSERVWHLPEAWLCMKPPTHQIAVKALPALKNGYVTYGAFGNLSKMGSGVVKLWSQILNAVPESKLFLKSKQLADRHSVQDVKRKFAEQGISESRLLIEAPSNRMEYLESYNQVDMILDTFPYPGGTTSVDALWMGVPVLTLKGDRFLSHLGESIMSNAGLEDWIAQDRNDFLRKGKAFSSDLGNLSSIRANLRARVLQSPLFDPPRFAKGFGDALHDMWRDSRQHRQS